MSEEEFIPTFARDLVKKRMAELGNSAKEWKEKADQNSDPYLKVSGITSALLFSHLETMFMFQQLNFYLVDRLVNAIEKLPKRDEFNEVKQELLIARKGIRDVVEPALKRLKEEAEREERADDVYG